MTREELLQHIDRLIRKYMQLYEMGKQPGHSNSPGPGERAEAEEFLRRFAGQNSAFYCRLREVHPGWLYFQHIVSALAGFRSYVAAGLQEAVTPERQAQFDVVTDLLDLAQTLLNEKAVHPGAAAMLIGATLEEYLRVWAERLGLELGIQKPGIDTYARLLRAEEAIGKQHLKDITAWAGLRNDAAHGKWEAVENRQRIQIMLEGVRLFMQQHGA